MTYSSEDYEIYVDWDDDGDLTNDGYATDSPRIEHIHIERGFSSPLARYPMVGRMTVRLDNSGRWYSPTQNANALPRREVEFKQGTSGGKMTELFRGFLESIAPYPGQYRDRYVILEGVDAIALLDQHESEIPIQENVYADDVIDLVVSDATYGAYTPPSTSYDAGLNHFPTSCERWNWEGSITVGGSSSAALRTERTNASQKVLAACMSDWGRFYISKSGVPTYKTRHYPIGASTALTLSNAMTEMGYTYGVQDIFNRVECTAHPRDIGTKYEVIGRISQGRAPMIEASGSSTFTIRYRDPANPSIRIGGKDIQTPVADTDYICTKDTGGGSGSDVGSITPTVTAYSDHADVQMDNGNAFPVFVQKLNLRGYAVRVREPITMVSEDATSQSDYQIRTLPINASLMDNTIDAKNLADYLIENYKDPQHKITGLQFCANHNSTLIAAARDLELLDKVVITEQQTGLSSFTGHVTRIAHDISQNGYLHIVTLDLETPYIPSGTPFTIGTSTLDGAHVFIY